MDIATGNLVARAVAHPTLDLAQWIAGVKYADLPGATREACRRALLDTLAAGLYGHAMPWARIVRDWAHEGAAGGQASVWGSTSPSLRAADAALVNGVAAHAFELDDYHNAKLHPGAVVVPAAVASAERLDASSEALLAAIAIGYEVMIRSSLALDPTTARLRGWHLTGVCGPFGAAAACASLLGLDATRTAWALGLAGTQAAGLFAFSADGAMSKRLHAGRAAQAGVVAAELAAAGFTGPTQVYEADDGGFLKTFSDAATVTSLTENLGAAYHIHGISVKPYASCGSTHAYIDAARALRARLGPRAADATRLKVGTSEVVALQCGFDYEPGPVLTAQLSVRYCVAVALLEGDALPAQFAPEKLADPQIVALARRVEIVHDPRLDQLYPEHLAGWVELELDGRWERADMLDPSGCPNRPLGPQEIAGKFRSLAAGSIPDEHIAAIAKTALHREGWPAHELVALCAIDPAVES